MRTSEGGFHALAIIPAVDGRFTAGISHAGHVGIRAATEALRDTGQGARPARGGRGDHNGGLGRLADGFRRRGIGAVARLGKILAGHTEIFRGRTGGDGIGGGLDGFTDEAHDEAGASDGLIQGAGRAKRFAGGFGKCAVRLGVGE